MISLTMKTPLEKFWLNWLKLVASFIILLGILMALFNQSAIFNIMNNYIGEAFYTSPIIPERTIYLQSWLVSVLGATMAGWGLTMLFIIIFPLQQFEKWAWYALLVSIIVWFIPDTFISSHLGADFNVVLNIIFLLLFATPLLFLRKSVNSKKVL